MKKKAFTIVELMIVIIVLSILSITGYMFYGDFKKSARDAVRKSDLNEIKTAIENYYIDNLVYPTPDNFSSGVYQDKHGNMWGTGTFGANLAQNLKEIKKLPTDPKTGKEYRYDLIENKKNYKLITTFEDTKEELVLSNRIKEGIVEGPYTNDITNYKFRYAIRKDSWKTVDSNCPLPDIEVLDSSGNLVETWAGCNSTLGEGIEWGINEDGSKEDKSNLECFNYSTGTVECLAVDNITSDMYSGANPDNYFNKVVFNGRNYSKDRDFNTIWGKLYNKQKSSSACPDGWSVPSFDDWKNLILKINPSCSLKIDEGNMCTSENMGWKEHYLQDNVKNVVNLLKISLSGYKSTSKFEGRGRYAVMGNTSNRTIKFCKDRIGINTAEGPSDKFFSVRCIKK